MKLNITEDKSNAWESFMVLIGQNNKAHNLVLPLMPCFTEDNSKEIEFGILGDFSMIKDFIDLKKPIELHVDYHDDPTSPNAGSVVSLGYALLRFTCRNATVKSINPLVITMQSGNFEHRINRCQRDSLIENPVSLPSLQFPKPELNEGSVLRKHYFMPKDYCGYLTVVGCITGKKNYTAIEVIDMTTFHAGPITLEQTEHRTKTLAKNNYKKLLKRYL